MKYVSNRVFNNITFYGYTFEGVEGVYWSMRFYPETWHIPMVVI